jgi:hypothetical protein
VLALAACASGAEPQPAATDVPHCDRGHAVSYGADGEERTSFCDPAQGLRCEPASGRCVGPCAGIGRSYVGCEYLGTVSANLVASEFPFAIAVSNVSGELAADVLVEGGELAEPLRFQVAPGDVRVETLPWVPDLKICMQERGIVCPDRPVSALARQAAYRVRSTAPVVVYQFSPLGYELDGRYSYTNDASLLVPTSALSTEYIVPGWPAGELSEEQGRYRSAGSIAITASEDDTEVTVHATAPIEPGIGVEATGGPVRAHLMRGDVLQLISLEGDLTGSRVEASAPVQVVSGHLCANVPEDTPYCDHLEEVVFPFDTLATEYAIVPPAIPGCDVMDAACSAPSAVRIVALADVTLEYDPPQALPARLAAGEVVDLARFGAPFVVRASGRILVTQFMHGQCSGMTADQCDETDRHGDPSMALAVPTAQFRDSFVFHAPTSYETRFATVIGPMSADVLLDGAPAAALSPIGASGLGYRRIQLAGEGSGNHRLASADRIGVAVYGYGRFTSFWYPGGLDLEPVELR